MNILFRRSYEKHVKKIVLLLLCTVFSTQTMLRDSDKIDLAIDVSTDDVATILDESRKLLETLSPDQSKDLTEAFDELAESFPEEQRFALTYGFIVSIHAQLYPQPEDDLSEVPDKIQFDEDTKNVLKDHIPQKTLETDIGILEALESPNLEKNLTMVNEMYNKYLGLLANHAEGFFEDILPIPNSDSESDLEDSVPNLDPVVVQKIDTIRSTALHIAYSPKDNPVFPVLFSKNFGRPDLKQHIKKFIKPMHDNFPAAQAAARNTLKLLAQVELGTNTITPEALNQMYEENLMIDTLLKVAQNHIQDQEDKIRQEAEKQAAWDKKFGNETTDDLLKFIGGEITDTKPMSKKSQKKKKKKKKKRKGEKPVSTTSGPKPVPIKVTPKVPETISKKEVSEFIPVSGKRTKSKKRKGKKPARRISIDTSSVSSSDAPAVISARSGSPAPSVIAPSTPKHSIDLAHFDYTTSPKVPLSPEEKKRLEKQQALLAKALKEQEKRTRENREELEKMLADIERKLGW